ncbi:hypothetical protein GEMRC1_013106 [Eukaryota sp. GEM-RC1]
MKTLIPSIINGFQSFDYLVCTHHASDSSIDIKVQPTTASFHVVVYLDPLFTIICDYVDLQSSFTSVIQTVNNLSTDYDKALSLVNLLVQTIASFIGTNFRPLPALDVPSNSTDGIFSSSDLMGSFEGFDDFDGFEECTEDYHFSASQVSIHNLDWIPSFLN